MIMLHIQMNTWYLQLKISKIRLKKSNLHTKTGSFQLKTVNIQLILKEIGMKFCTNRSFPLMKVMINITFKPSIKDLTNKDQSNLIK